MPAPELSIYKILFVDSDSDSVKRAEAILMMIGIRNAEICYSADEALEVLRRGFRPDIALISPDLAGIHGIQLIKKIRSFLDAQKSDELPILLLINKPSKEMFRHACRAGIEGAVRKPMEHTKIGRMMQAAIKTPRRFIAIRDYFGPERRNASDLSYSGPERRKPLAEHEAIATKSRHGEEEKKAPEVAKPQPAPTVKKATEEPKAQPLPNVTPISEYELPTPLEEQIATKPKGGKLIEADELPKEPVKPEAKLEQKPVEKPKAAIKPKPAEKPVAAKPVAPIAPAKPVAPPKEEVAAVKPPAEKPQPKKAPAQPKKEEKGLEAAPVEKPKKEAVEEVEIVDIDEALLSHRLWVDSAGKEGHAMSVARANLRGADLESADLTGASLVQANFTDANLKEVVLRKANLTGAIFSNTQLIGANLAVARLKKANLSNARLDKAVLRGADLTGARFKGASLLRIDLSSANLANADLSGVNLSTAIGLIQEQIDRAFMDKKTTLPAGLQVSPAVLARKAKAGLAGLKAKAVRAPNKA